MNRKKRKEKGRKVYSCSSTIPQTTEASHSFFIASNNEIKKEDRIETAI
jgi:hypothetical protein